MTRGRWPGIAAAWLLALLACPLPATAETLLVVRKSADALDLVDPGSGLRLFSVAVGHAPHEVSVAPDGRHAAVSNYGTRERPGASVSIVDLAQPHEARRIELGRHTRPHGIAWYAPDRVAVTTEGSRHLLLVDPLAGKVVAEFDTGQDGSHLLTLAGDGRQAYVANIGSGSVTRVELDGAAPPRTIAAGRGSEGIALAPGGDELWVTARQEGLLLVLQPTTLEPLARIELAGAPIRVVFAPDGATAYVTCAASGELIAFDVASRRELARRRIDLPPAADAATRPAARLAPGSPLPVGVLVAADGRTVYVSATMADRVLRLDARTLEVLGTIDVGGEPDGLGLTAVVPQATCHACAAPAAAATQHSDL